MALPISASRAVGWRGIEGPGGRGKSTGWGGPDRWLFFLYHHLSIHPTHPNLSKLLRQPTNDYFYFFRFRWWLGGHTDRALLIEERGGPKKGSHSVGVARQRCGQLGKVENGQVGGVATPSRGPEVTWIDGRWLLPEAWTTDPARCQAAGLPKAHRGFPRKTDLALAMIAHARRQGLGLAWVGFAGFSSSDPGFLRALDDRGEVFVGDVHQDQRVDWEDPRPLVPPAQNKRQAVIDSACRKQQLNG